MMAAAALFSGGIRDYVLGSISGISGVVNP